MGADLAPGTDTQSTLFMSRDGGLTWKAVSTWMNRLKSLQFVGSLAILRLNSSVKRAFGVGYDHFFQVLNKAHTIAWARYGAFFAVSKSDIDGLVQERRSSIANALELCLSCTNSLMCIIMLYHALRRFDFICSMITFSLLHSCMYKCFFFTANIVAWLFPATVVTVS